MADDSRENDSTSIDSAINELAERKNDIGSDKPSTSTPQKRPSPNANEHQLTSKRLNALLPPPSPSLPPDSLHNTSLNAANESVIARATDDDDDNHHHRAGNTNESDEMDILATNVTHKSRSIEKTTASINTMCISPKLTDRKFMIDLESTWSRIQLYEPPGNDDAARKLPKNNCTKFNDDSVKLYKQPFQICVISDFLANASFTRQLVNEMCDMEWRRKEMDLYLFHQTSDLANLSDLATTTKPALKQFHSLLTDKMLPWMRKITGLSLTRVSASCSMYNFGDYLLVHDDLLSDRQIAFVFYLSPWFTEWTEQMGGALELFETDLGSGQPKYPIVEKFPPRNNQFIFFQVCEQSFHQVGEVTSSVYPRLTINGWFHGPAVKKVDFSNSIELISSDGSGGDTTVAADTTAECQAYHVANRDELDLNDWINSYYLKKRVKQSIQKHIENKSEASLEMFLIAEFFDTLSTEFKSPDLNWVLEGPANQRKYERLCFARNATGPLKDLYSLFTSDSMFELLQDYTELDLSGLNAATPTCNVQLCRFTQGCYTLLGDSTTFADSALDVILFFNARDGVGKITYLSPSQGISTEYDTTTETDVTTANTNTTANLTMDQSSTAEAGDISSTSSITVVKNNASNQKQSKQTANRSKSQTLNEGESMEISDDDDDDDDEDGGSIDESIRATRTKQKSATARTSVCKVTVRADVHEHQKSSDSENSSMNIDSSMNEDGVDGGGSSSHDFDADDHEDVSDGDSDDDLDNEEHVEDALLTIHPKNNSLNLVYRLSGQAKFVKYISKNSLKPDEYVYILFASYKE